MGGRRLYEKCGWRFQFSEEYSPVNRWKIIRPQVMETGLTRRALRMTAFTLAMMASHEMRGRCQDRTKPASWLDVDCDCCCCCCRPGWPLAALDTVVVVVVATEDIRFSRLILDVRTFDRMVSSSISTFLCGPRSHCSELEEGEEVKR